MKRLKYFVTGVCVVSLLGASLCGCGKTEDKKSGSGKKHKETSAEEVEEEDRDAGSADRETDDKDVLDMGDKEAAAPAHIDVDSVNWEDMYEWTDNEITGLKEIPDEIKANGVLVIPARCETIAEDSLQDNSWIKEVRFEDQSGVAMIGNDAFGKCTQLHSFVFPENANLFQEGEYLQKGTAPFGNNRLMQAETRLHNVVMPNGVIPYYTLLEMTNFFADTPVNNQVYMDNLYCPENFEVNYADFGSQAIPINKKFAKYTREYYDENFSAFGECRSTARFATTECTIYVVEGSWADENFDNWTTGDLIKKEYWDGKSYTFPENDPIWDISEIVIWDDLIHTTFESLEDDYEARTLEDGERTYEGRLTEADFNALAEEIFSLAEDGTISEDRAKYRIHVDGHCDETEYTYYTDDESVVKALIDKYAK